MVKILTPKTVPPAAAAALSRAFRIRANLSGFYQSLAQKTQAPTARKGPAKRYTLPSRDDTTANPYHHYRPPTKRPATKTPKPRPPRHVPLPTPTHPPGSTTRSKDQKITTSIRIAAEWLATYHPRAVKQQGYATFIAARTAEMLAHQFPPQYWDTAAPRAPMCVDYTATSLPSAKQATPPYYDPARLATDPTWSNAGTPYSAAVPGQPGSVLAARYIGVLTQGYFTDASLRAALQTFDAPRPWLPAELAPVFFEVRAQYQTNADKPPSRVMFSTYAKAAITGDNTPTKLYTAPLPTTARRYIWTRKIPPGGALNYTATMYRHYLIDALVRTWEAPNDDGKCNALSLYLAPAAAMGHYYGRASQVQTLLAYDIDCYMAKKEPKPPKGPAYVYVAGATVKQESAGVLLDNKSPYPYIARSIIRGGNLMILSLPAWVFPRLGQLPPVVRCVTRTYSEPGNPLAPSVLISTTPSYSIAGPIMATPARSVNLADGYASGTVADATIARDWGYRPNQVGYMTIWLDEDDNLQYAPDIVDPYTL